MKYVSNSSLEIKHLFQREAVIAGKYDHCVVHGILLLLLDLVWCFYCSNLIIREKKYTKLTNMTVFLFLIYITHNSLVIIIIAEKHPLTKCTAFSIKFNLQFTFSLALMLLIIQQPRRLSRRENKHCWMCVTPSGFGVRMEKKGCWEAVSLTAVTTRHI